MRKFKYGDQVTYVGLENKWTFQKDLLPQFRGKINQVIETPISINYMVEFENGLEASIDRQYLELLH
jgi:hypothetical protein